MTPNAAARPLEGRLVVLGITGSIAAYKAPELVRALRASSLAPFAKTTISGKEIEALNLAQDLPFLISQTPSVVINSDAGNGVGYTGIRIRGTDANRVGPLRLVGSGLVAARSVRRAALASFGLAAFPDHGRADRLLATADAAPSGRPRTSASHQPRARAHQLRQRPHKAVRV